jgi:hypothetical protein
MAIVQTDLTDVYSPEAVPMLQNAYADLSGVWTRDGLVAVGNSSPKSKGVPLPSLSVTGDVLAGFVDDATTISDTLTATFGQRSLVTKDRTAKVGINPNDFRDNFKFLQPEGKFNEIKMTSKALSFVLPKLQGVIGSTVSREIANGDGTGVKIQGFAPKIKADTDTRRFEFDGPSSPLITKSNVISIMDEIYKMMLTPDVSGHLPDVGQGSDYQYLMSPMTHFLLEQANKETNTSAFYLDDKKFIM